MIKLNEEKFVNVLGNMGMYIPQNASVKVKQQETGHVIASVGGHQFKVRGDVWVRFVKDIEQEKVESIYGLMESSLSGVEYIAILEDAELDIELPLACENVEELSNEIKDAINERVSNIITFVGGKVRKIAELVNIQIPILERNGDIIKDFDGMLSFDTKLGEEFNLYLCFDKIPPIFETPTTIEIMRTPMSEDDKKLYLGETLPLITKMIDEINESIQNLYKSKLVSFSDLSKKYVSDLITGAIVNHILEITPIIISFGGVDNWRLYGDLTPNSEVCHKLLDKEVEHLINTLQAIPLQEGVDFYSIDLQQLGVYGRNNNYQVVTGVVVEVTKALESRWSNGFMELFKLRLRQNDSKHLFFY